MDFWSRLIAGVGTPKKAPPVNDPDQRLARFKRVYNQILQIWQKTSPLSSDSAATENLRINLARLTSILQDESRSPSPHLCLSFASSSQVYRPIGRIAVASHNEPVVREAVAVFAALIDSEEEDFLVSKRFSLSLMTFIEKTIGSGLIGEDTESEMVELLFGIAAKIRLQPDVLPVWFAAAAKQNGGSASRSRNTFVGMTQKEDFPLCYQLIDHVHHEGRIGDFARTGLLYIFESASKSSELEQWIVESDLATLMATGLGALYSQLNRKLSILHPPNEDMPVILAFSDYSELRASSQVESVFSPEFQTHISTFLSYLAFWQDVLDHCRSMDVRQTLIDHFQVLFLQQLLYPSLLESSDADGGSSVAVMTYLRRIIDALDHPELIHMILEYLLALQDPMIARENLPRSPVAAARRMSLMLLNEPENEDDRYNPSLFSLVDLVQTGAGSRNPQAVIAALKLTTVILSKRHEYAAGTLFKVVESSRMDPLRTVGALNKEISIYLAIATSIAGDAGINEAYEAHLHDMQKLLESHACSLRQICLPGLQTLPPNAMIGPKKDVGPHYIISDDPLLKSLLDLLRHFLINDVETNLGLTEIILTLIACSQLRLDGLLAVEPSKYQFEPSTTKHDPALESIYKARRVPSWSSQNDPPVLAAIKAVEAQVQSLRSIIPEFDEHVSNRKAAFRVHEEINEAMQAPPPEKTVPTPRNNSSDNVPTVNWVNQLPKFVREASNTQSRSESPRGRKEGRQTLPESTTSSPRPSKFFEAALGSSSPIPRKLRELSPATFGSPRANSSEASTSVPLQGNLMKDVVGTLASIANSEALQKRLIFTTRPGNDTTVTLANTTATSNKGRNNKAAQGRGRGSITPAASQTVKDGSETSATTATNNAAPKTDNQQNHQPETDNASSAANQGVPTDKDNNNNNNNNNNNKQAVATNDQDKEDEEDQVFVQTHDASLSHILTNTVILQEFILELVALMQVRASLLGEVKVAEPPATSSLPLQ